MCPYSGGDCHIGITVDARGIEDAAGDCLIPRSPQSEAVGPCVRTRILRTEVVVWWKDSGGIGTSEFYVTIDNRVPLSLDGNGYGN